MQFHKWFMWGFIINVAALVNAVLQFAFAATESPIFGKLSACVACPLGCGALAWFIAGMVLRWREIGNVCSGDYALENGVNEGVAPYQWKSGKFIHIYYIVCLSLVGAICCCACTFGAIAAANK